jgi:hypothetical protein
MVALLQDDSCKEVNYWDGVDLRSTNPPITYFTPGFEEQLSTRQWCPSLGLSVVLPPGLWFLWY